jgi:kinesin family protein 6/9
MQQLISFTSLRFRSVTQGYNGSLLVYGQTGAGKTFTMSGGEGNYKTRGAIPRAIQEVFTEVQKKPQQVPVHHNAFMDDERC